LNRLRVPTAYQIAGHSNGKRIKKTAGLWYSGRIRNILVNPVYRGTHYYGKRSRKRPEPIERQVPPIVDAATWDRAQEQLKKNRLWSPRNGKQNYLLRGMMRCSLCGRVCYGSDSYASRRYYLCGGKTNQAYAADEFSRGRCPSRAVPGSIELVVWADIESFLRNPGPVIEEVAESLDDLKDQVESLRKDAAAAERALKAKNSEREAVLALYRRGRIDDATLDQQLDEIERERVGLTEALRDAQERLRVVEGASAHLRDAEAVLRTLNARLDGPLTFALKRDLVETLVESIKIDTVPEDGKRKLIATIRYRFSPLDQESSFTVKTHRGASRNWGVSRVYRCVVRTTRGQWGFPAAAASGGRQTPASRLGQRATPGHAAA
jgi:site-specific DNA recombinase